MGRRWDRVAWCCGGCRRDGPGGLGGRERSIRRHQQRQATHATASLMSCLVLDATPVPGSVRACPWCEYASVGVVHVRARSWMCLDLHESLVMLHLISRPPVSLSLSLSLSLCTPLFVAGIGISSAPHPLGPFTKHTQPVASPTGMCGGSGRCDDVIMQSRPDGVHL